MTQRNRFLHPTLTIVNSCWSSRDLSGANTFMFTAFRVCLISTRKKCGGGERERQKQGAGGKFPAAPLCGVKLWMESFAGVRSSRRRSPDRGVYRQLPFVRDLQQEAVFHSPLALQILSFRLPYPPKRPQPAWNLQFAWGQVTSRSLATKPWFGIRKCT